MKDRADIIRIAVRLYGDGVTVPDAADGGGYWRIGDGKGGRHVLNAGGFVVCPAAGHEKCYERQAWMMQQAHEAEDRQRARPRTWHFRCGWCGLIHRGAADAERAGDALERHNAECMPRRRFIHDTGASRLRYVLNEGKRL